MARQQKLAIAGAGPVGMVAALAAHRAGFDVEVFDAAPGIDGSPRAATTHPSTLAMLAELGLIERFCAEGLVARTFQFWNNDGNGLELVATFDHELLRDETEFPFVVQTEQHKLARICRDELARRGVVVRFGTCLTGFEQDADGVRVTVERDGARDESRVGWLLGTDGGRSTVRKQLGVDFEGFTWPERFLVYSVRDDIEAAAGCCFRNYVAGRGSWTNLFKVAGDDGRGLWRAVFPARADETDEDAFADATVQRRLHGLMPLGRDFDVAHKNVYRVHQRVAATFRVGRVLLAGDASHVNNPIGGLGLNFGIHDAVDAVATLRRVAIDGEADALLDGYARRRRDLNIRFVQEQTVANKKRLEEKDEAKRRAGLDAIRATAADPASAKAFLLRSSLIASTRDAAQIA